MVSVGHIAISSHTLLIFAFVEYNPCGETKHCPRGPMEDLRAQHHHLGFCYPGLNESQESWRKNVDRLEVRKMALTWLGACVLVCVSSS